MQKKIRVGMAGCGAITQRRHAPEYWNNPLAEIGGFYDFDPARAAQLSARYSGMVYESFDAMLADESLDTISVCSPNSTHAQMSIQALRAGKHVLCEKPMALTLEDTREMLRAQEQSGKILMPGHNQRLIPTHLKAKQLLDQGAIGRPLFVQCNFKHAGPETWCIDTTKNTWFFSKQKAHFGVFGDLGSHKIDLIRFLTGHEIEWVFATMLTLDKTYEDGSFIDLEDNAVCQFRMQDGMPGIMHFSWSNYGKEDNGTFIYGDQGVMKIFGDYAEDIVLEMRDQSTVKYSVSRISTNGRQLKSGVIDEFIAAISEGRQPIVTGVDGHNTMAVINAGIRSNEQGAWLKVDY